MDEYSDVLAFMSVSWLLVTESVGGYKPPAARSTRT
jgi:hypothetical protein